MRFNVPLSRNWSSLHVLHTSLETWPVFVTHVFDDLRILQFVNIQRECHEYSRPQEGELSGYNSHELSNFGHSLMFWYIWEHVHCIVMRDLQYISIVLFKAIFWLPHGNSCTSLEMREYFVSNYSHLNRFHSTRVVHSTTFILHTSDNTPVPHSHLCCLDYFM